MTTTAIRKKLVNYLQTAADKKVRAIYTMVADEIETQAHEFDEDFFKELDRRSKSIEDGTAKMYTIEDAKKIARDRIKSKKK